MKNFALALLVFSAPFCFAEKLTYYSPKPHFEVERSPKDLVFRSAQYTLKLTLKPCNLQLVTRFWESAKKAFEQYPVTRAIPKTEYAELDGKRRLIVPGVHSGRLPSIEQGFLSLFALEKKLCKS